VSPPHRRVQAIPLLKESRSWWGSKPLQWCRLSTQNANVTPATAAA
jgi:hypothetical protein